MEEIILNKDGPITSDLGIEVSNFIPNPLFEGIKQYYLDPILKSIALLEAEVAQLRRQIPSNGISRNEFLPDHFQ